MGLNIKVAGVLGVAALFNFLQLCMSGAYFNWSFSTSAMSGKQSAWTANAAFEHCAITSIIVALLILTATGVAFSTMFMTKPSASVTQTLLAVAFAFTWISFGFACKTAALKIPSYQCQQSSCSLGSGVKAVIAFSVLNWIINTAAFVVVVFVAAPGADKEYATF
eukprot:a676600_307.p1 GENE.a676600_307~~a676600_307.p1  ORF type:complete len:174 (+),score=75.93 a676600_307:28-522(+)